MMYRINSIFYFFSTTSIILTQFVKNDNKIFKLELFY